MKVLLSVLNAKYIHSSLALRYLRSYARKEGLDYDLAEYTINMPIYDILRSITEKNIDVIGMCCYIWNMDMTLHLIRLLKLVAPQVIVVLGGPEVTYSADEILQEHPYVDFIMQGEGEASLVELVRRLKAGDRYPEDIPGMRGITQEGCLYGSQEIVEMEDLSEIPFPYSEEDMETLKHRIIYYESSRGCPFSCQYCLSGNKNKVRFFPLERTLQELQWFMDHGVKQVKFVDRTFNCSKNHHLPIMHFLKEAHTETNFHLEMEGVLLGEEEVEILSSAPKGRFQIEVGVQSTNEETLRAIRRLNKWDHISKHIAPIIASGRTHVHMDLIIGLPHESYTIFKKSFSDLFRLRPHALQLGFLKLLKGSGVRNMDTCRYVYDPKPPYEVLMTHVLSYEEIRFLKVFEDVFESYYNSEKYVKTFTALHALIEQYEKGQAAFTIFEHLTKAWIAANHHMLKLGDKERAQFLLEHLPKIVREVLKDSSLSDILYDMIRWDVLVTFKGQIKADVLDLPVQSKATLQHSQSFWNDETLVRNYIPNYTFREWRRIRQDYYELTVSEAMQQWCKWPSRHMVIHVLGDINPFSYEKESID